MSHADRSDRARLFAPWRFPARIPRVPGRTLRAVSVAPLVLVAVGVLTGVAGASTPIATTVAGVGIAVSISAALAWRVESSRQ